MHSSRARFLVALFAALCLLAFAASCSRGVDDETDNDNAGDSTEAASLTPYKPDPSREGSIAGTVNFEGAAPARKSISMDADAVCARTNADPTAEDIVVNGDKLANVFVYIKEGRVGDKSFGGYSFSPPVEPAVLDQKGCQYVPHVLGVQVNQTVNVLNSDETAHNVNVDAKQNEKFNAGQPPRGAPIVRQFKRAETVIPVKCNQHPWMRAYVGVLQHPFYAVSDKEGKFEIRNVPAGTYTLVAWHEKYPQGVTQTITVAPGAAAASNFSFTSEQLKAEHVEGGALLAMPAIEFPMIGMHH